MPYLGFLTQEGYELWIREIHISMIKQRGCDRVYIPHDVLEMLVRLFRVRAEWVVHGGRMRRSGGKQLDAFVYSR